jgi:hypothetical protein
MFLQMVVLHVSTVTRENFWIRNTNKIGIQLSVGFIHKESYDAR